MGAIVVIAIVALTVVALHDASTRDDVREQLFIAARRPLEPATFQHVIEPAIHALLELGELTPELARELDEGLGPDDL